MHIWFQAQLLSVSWAKCAECVKWLESVHCGWKKAQCRKLSAEMRRVFLGSVQNGTSRRGYASLRGLCRWATRSMVPRVPLRVPMRRLREGCAGLADHTFWTFCLRGRRCSQKKNAAQMVCPSDAKRSSSWWRKTCGTDMRKD